ncbi:hypothetical protein A2U01_0090761, partial [Trifolium medium]|nr:hypothetical protein [Trifolium medium]
MSGMLQEEWNVRIRHVYHEANKVADALASIRCHSVGCIIFEDPPVGVDP